MAINRVDYPTNLTDQSDFSAHGTLIEARFTDQTNAPQWVVSGNIPQGVVLQIGGVVYRSDSNTAITGTASDYVMITPAGATASAAYVASLSGVSWAAQYNGYYDASENLYLFDEGKALSSGEISAVFGRYLMQQPNGNVQVGNNLDVEGTLDAGGNTTVGGTLGVTGSTTLGGPLIAPSTGNVLGWLGNGSSQVSSGTLHSVLRDAMIAAGIPSNVRVGAMGHVRIGLDEYYYVNALRYDTTNVYAYWLFAQTPGIGPNSDPDTPLTMPITNSGRWRLKF